MYILKVFICSSEFHNFFLIFKILQSKKTGGILQNLK